MLEYKGFRGTMCKEHDNRSSMILFYGKIQDIKDSITYHGRDLEELEADFQAAVDHYLA